MTQTEQNANENPAICTPEQMYGMDSALQLECSFFMCRFTFAELVYTFPLCMRLRQNLQEECNETYQVPQG